MPVGSIDDPGILRQGSDYLFTGGGIGDGNAVAAFRRASLQQPGLQSFLIAAVIQPGNHIAHHIAYLAFIQQFPLGVGGQVHIILSQVVYPQTAGGS